MIKDKDAIYLPENLFVWFILAFQGGYVNAGGFLAVHRFVSHVTGFATWVGLEFAQQHYLDAFGMLLVPMFYMAGSMISAWFIERRRIQSLRPRYGLVLNLITTFFFVSWLLGELNFFGPFGQAFNYQSDYILLFLLSMSCGLQNAVISSASGAVVRTTHLTGITTDLGIGLVRLWTLRKQIDIKEVFANWFRAGTIISFVTGSIIGALFFTHFEFRALCVPVFISFYVSIRLSRKIKDADFQD